MRRRLTSMAFLGLFLGVTSVACGRPRGSERHASPGSGGSASGGSGDGRAGSGSGSPGGSTPGGLPEAGAEALLSRRQVDTRKHPTAVCNDGSTPVFYVRRGSEARKWVVWFKGGEACGDIATCKERSGSLTSSRSWMQIDTLGDEGNADSADGRAGGILSRRAEVNPDFHDWNHVYLVYCSSDIWSGDKSAEQSGFGFHFRGHDIATAMIDALMDPEVVGHPALSDASHVLFTGSSAGAGGMRNNVDRLVGMLPKGIDIRAFSDAALSPSVTPVRTGGEAEGWITRKAFWGAVPDASCVAAKPDAQEWECLEGRILAEEGHLSTPTFWHQDQRDIKVMGHFDRNDPAQMERSRSAAEEIRRVMGGLSGAFSPATGNHILLNEEKFHDVRVDGQCAAEVFGNWYFGRSGPKVVIDDNDGASGRNPDRPRPGSGDRPSHGPGGRPDRRN